MSARVIIEASELDPRTRRYVLRDGLRVGRLLRTRVGLYVGQQMWEYRPEEAGAGKVLAARTFRQIEQQVKEMLT